MRGISTTSANTIPSVLYGLSTGYYMQRHTYGEIEINERTIERQLVVYSGGRRVASMSVIDRVDSCDIYNYQGSYDFDIRDAIKRLLQRYGYKSVCYIRERRDGKFTTHERKR